MELTNELNEFLNPVKTVLLIWDVQKRLVQGIFNTETFIANNKEVILAAKQCKVPVIFSKINPLPEKFESPVRKILFKNRMALLKDVPNGLDFAIEPTQDDIVIPKNTASMFIGTNFEQLLRNAGITTIAITGIATEYGVESTARDAMNRGFVPVIITDAVSSFNQEGHNRSLENLKSMTILLKTEDIISKWNEFGS